MEWKQFPTELAHYYQEIDKTAPYETLLKGGYRAEIELFGKIRDYYVYYPENMEYSCRGILLLVESKAQIDKFLEVSGWKNLADKEKILLMISGGDKNPWGGSEDKEFLNQLIREYKNRKYMDTKQDYFYSAAYGDAADLLHNKAMVDPCEFAGIVLAGEIHTGEAVMREVPLPILFAGDQEEPFSAAMEYWKAADCVEEVPYIQNGMKIWIQKKTGAENYMENRPIARVQYCQDTDLLNHETTQKFWDFLSATVRCRGIGNGQLRAYKTMEQMGFRKQQVNINGYTRQWYEYIPEHTQALGDGKLPVVVYCHGGSATPVSDAHYHEWAAVAKERGFILAMPYGTMRRMNDMMPHPAWNAAHLQDHMDDEALIREMLESISERYPVDKGRIYVNGHSMGSAMAQRLALLMPDTFAAVAGNSGVTKGGFMGSFDAEDVSEKAMIPIWVQMGERDIGGGTLDNNTDARHAMEYWTSRYQIKDFEHPCRWRSGRYLFQEWNNDRGVPMVRFSTVMEKPHIITPQDAFMYYDEFFSMYSRGEKGELYYKGKEVL